MTRKKPCQGVGELRHDIEWPVSSAMPRFPGEIPGEVPGAGRLLETAQTSSGSGTFRVQRIPPGNRPWRSSYCEFFRVSGWDQLCR